MFNLFFLFQVSSNQNACTTYMKKSMLLNIHDKFVTNYCHITTPRSFETQCNDLICAAFWRSLDNHWLIGLAGKISMNYFSVHLSLSAHVIVLAVAMNMQLCNYILLCSICETFSTNICSAPRLRYAFFSLFGRFSCSWTFRCCCSECTLCLKRSSLS